MALGQQSLAATRLALGTLLRRPSATFSSLAAVTLVVFVLLGFLAMAAGYRQTLASAGSDDVAVLLRSGATSATSSMLGPDQLAALEGAPGIASGPSGRKAISPELTLPVSAERQGDGSANLIIRGIAPESGFIMRGIRMIAGRAPAPGSNELIVGRAAAAEFAGIAIGRPVHLGSDSWTVVGIFAAGGGVYESEARADLHVVQAFAGEGARVQSARVALTEPGGLAALKAYLAGQPQLELYAQGERDYFAGLSKRSQNFIARLGWPLALIMAIGALAGLANTLFASIAAREREILTLRLLGFGRRAIFAGIIAESLAVALAGALLGIVLAAIAFEGLHSSTAGTAMGQIMFEFHLAPKVLAQAVLLALAVGVGAALLPALAAVRRKLVLSGCD